jgi:hypothetical protein
MKEIKIIHYVFEMQKFPCLLNIKNKFPSFVCEFALDNAGS